MEYGILIAIAGDVFQMVGAASSPAEAREMAASYIDHGADLGWLVPDFFELHGRTPTGGYSMRERWAA